MSARVAEDTRSNKKQQLATRTRANEVRTNVVFFERLLRLVYHRYGAGVQERANRAGNSK
jgi:hypothetical protein